MSRSLMPVLLAMLLVVLGAPVARAQSAELKVTVVDGDGTPLRGLVVACGPLHGKTDAEGVAHFDAAPVGAVELSVVPRWDPEEPVFEFFAVAEKDAVVAADGTAVEIVVPRAWWRRLMFRRGGRPILPEGLRVSCGPGEARLHLVARREEAGTVDFIVFPQREAVKSVSLTVKAEELMPREVPVSASDAAPLVVDLEPGPSVRVELRGLPVGGGLRLPPEFAFLLVRERTGEVFELRDVTRRGGTSYRFAAEGLDLGTHRLVGLRSGLDREVRIDAENPVREIVLEASEFVGLTLAVPAAVGDAEIDLEVVHPGIDVPAPSIEGAGPAAVATLMSLIRGLRVRDGEAFLWVARDARPVFRTRGGWHRCDVSYVPPTESTEDRLELELKDRPVLRIPVVAGSFELEMAALGSSSRENSFVPADPKADVFDLESTEGARPFPMRVRDGSVEVALPGAGRFRVFVPVHEFSPILVEEVVASAEGRVLAEPFRLEAPARLLPSLSETEEESEEVFFLRLLEDGVPEHRAITSVIVVSLASGGASDPLVLPPGVYRMDVHAPLALVESMGTAMGGRDGDFGRPVSSRKVILKSGEVNRVVIDPKAYGR